MKLWLTYAWKDNEDADVDFVIEELKRTGLEVDYDRVRLLAGRRLWDQIASAIAATDVTAWALYATENSLKSEPCQEEMAYALDKALRKKGVEFPLIGIFPKDIDSDLIPPAIRTRLYVNTRSNDWAFQVADGVRGVKAKSETKSLDPFGYKIHPSNDGFVFEVWPRTGNWVPFDVYIPASETDLLGVVMTGPRNYISGTGMVSIAFEGKISENWYLRRLAEEVNNTRTGHVFLKSLPSKLRFGKGGSTVYEMSFK